MNRSAVLLIYGFFVGLLPLGASAKQVNLKNACNEPQRLAMKTDSGFQVTFVRYSYPDSYERGKLVLMYPPTGGLSQVDRRFARNLCRNGFNAIIIEDFTDYTLQTLEIGYNNIVLENTLRATKLLRRRYRHEFFGMFGISAGGIAASTMVDDFEGDLDAIFLVTVGGPLHSIIARAGAEGLTKMRERRMRRFGITDIADYESAIKASLSMEIPTRISDELKVGMILSTNDEIVQDEYQRYMFTIWAPDHAVRYDSGHVRTILSAAAQYTDEVAEFFNSASSSK